MKKMPLTLFMSIMATLLLVSLAQAGELTREDFTGVTPFTFDGMAAVTAPYDFGVFTAYNFYSMEAYWMPFNLPVALPAPGGENMYITLDPPQAAVGMDVSLNTNVTFFGAGDMPLATFPASYVPNVWNRFVGYMDDNGALIHKVQIGTWDAFFDNVYVGDWTVATESGSWSEIKTLFH